MNTLREAWDWYRATRRNLARMQRLGMKHWDDPSLENASFWSDEQFKTVNASMIVQDTTSSLEPIDDLAVVVLFSVFESNVWDFLVSRIELDAVKIVDPILKQAADEAIRGVEEGSFYRRVLEPLKEQRRVPADLVTQVDQVRTYRNWVAHGMREAQREDLANINPRTAYERLAMFLDELGISAEPEWDEPGEQTLDH